MNNSKEQESIDTEHDVATAAASQLLRVFFNEM